MPRAAAKYQTGVRLAAAGLHLEGVDMDGLRRLVAGATDESLRTANQIVTREVRKRFKGRSASKHRTRRSYWGRVYTNEPALAKAVSGKTGVSRRNKALRYSRVKVWPGYSVFTNYGFRSAGRYVTGHFELQKSLAATQDRLIPALRGELARKGF